MVNSRVEACDKGMLLPLSSCKVKVTVGICPARVLVTPVILRFMPASSVSGFWGYKAAVSVATTWAPRMEASKGDSPCGIWQLAHWVSSAWNPPGWLAPVAKLRLSWQGAQARRLGLGLKALGFAPPAGWAG